LGGYKSLLQKSKREVIVGPRRKAGEQSRKEEDEARRFILRIHVCNTQVASLTHIVNEKSAEN